MVCVSGHQCYTSEAIDAWATCITHCLPPAKCKPIFETCTSYVIKMHARLRVNLQKSTKAIMDQFVLGRRRVNCEIIEADGKGNPPDEDDFDGSSQSLLDVIVEKNDKV